MSFKENNSLNPWQNYKEISVRITPHTDWFPLGICQGGRPGFKNEGITEIKRNFSLKCIILKICNWLLFGYLKKFFKRERKVKIPSKSSKYRFRYYILNFVFSKDFYMLPIRWEKKFYFSSIGKLTFLPQVHHRVVLRKLRTRWNKRNFYPRIKLHLCMEMYT